MVVSSTNSKLAAAFKARQRQKAQAMRVAARERAQAAKARREAGSKRLKVKRKRQDALRRSVKARERAESARGRRESASSRQGRRSVFVRTRGRDRSFRLNPLAKREGRGRESVQRIQVRKPGARSSTAAPTKQQTANQRDIRLAKAVFGSAQEITLLGATGRAGRAGGPKGGSPKGQRQQVKRQGKIEFKRVEKAVGSAGKPKPATDFSDKGKARAVSTDRAVQGAKRSIARSEQKRQQRDAIKKRLQDQENRSAQARGRKPKRITDAEVKRLQNRPKRPGGGGGTSSTPGEGKRVAVKERKIAEPLMKVEPPKQKAVSRTERRKAQVEKQRRERTDRRAQARAQLRQTQVNQKVLDRQIEKQRRRLERAKARADKRSSEKAEKRLKALEQGKRNLSKRERALRVTAAGAATGAAASSVFAPKGGEEVSARDDTAATSSPGGSESSSPGGSESSSPGGRESSSPGGRESESTSPGGSESTATGPATEPRGGEQQQPAGGPGPDPGTGTGESPAPIPAPTPGPSSGVEAPPPPAPPPPGGGGEPGTPPPPGGGGSGGGGGATPPTSGSEPGPGGGSTPPTTTPGRGRGSARATLTLPRARKVRNRKNGQVPVEVTYRAGIAERSVNLRTGKTRTGKDLSAQVTNNPKATPAESLRVTKTAAPLPGEPRVRRVRLFGSRGGEVAIARVTANRISFSRAPGVQRRKRRGSGQPRRSRRRRG